MDRYTHLYAGNLASALDALPDLSGPVRQVTVATGTDGPQVVGISLSPGLSPGGGIRKSPMESGGANGDGSAQEKTPGNKGFAHDSQGFSTNERDGARTRNHRIDSPVL